ncbi:MAG TPA: response regulator transcription factor [Bdellovibrionales bacterium]|nr:response regulator transcription factor [Bdellovibrionales bacterium]
MKRVLLVEDDQRLSDHLSKVIAAEGIAAKCATSFDELESLIDSREEFSAVVLDRLLGPKDAKEKLPAIKRRWPNAPILVLSAINTPAERTDLINLGADDYLGKPFLTQELLARLNAVSRRIGTGQESYRKFGNLVLEMTKRLASVGEKSELLPAKEFLLLKVLTDDPGRVLNRSELLESVWGSSALVETNVVEATISNLRRRLSDLGANITIKNMRNAGYWIED